MAIDSNGEQVITLTEAAKRLPARRAGKQPHVSCLYRWTTVGCRGVVLDAIQIGGTRCTSVEALERFFEQLTADAGVPRLATRPNRMTKRRQSNTNKKLDAIGI